MRHEGQLNLFPPIYCINISSVYCTAKCLDTNVGHVYTVPLCHGVVVFPAHLQRAALGRVENQEAAQDSLTVCGHIEGHAVLSP